MVNETSQREEPAHPKPRPVKLTVELSPDLHRRLRVHAAVEGTTVAAVVRELLRERLHDW